MKTHKKKEQKIWCLSLMRSSMNSWMPPSTPRKLTNHTNTTIDLPTNNNNSKFLNIHHRQLSRSKQQNDKIISSTRGKYRRWRCKIKSMKGYFLIVVIIIKSEAMASKFLKKQIYPKEIASKIKIIHTPISAYPSMLQSLQEQNNLSPFITLSFVTINF